MNYYEQKMLQDRENRGIGGGLVFILISPIMGFIGAFIGDAAGAATLGFYIGTLVGIATGIAVMVGWVKEKRARSRNQIA
jgi:hypothetical protein